MASENETPVKKAKSGTWDNIDVFRELSIVFYNRLDNGGGLTPEFKEAVAAYLGGRGHDVSWNALRQHIQKLRKSRDMSRLNEGANEESKSKPTTPAKRTVSAASTPRKRKTPTKKAKGKGAEDEQCDDEEEESFEDHMAKLEAEDDMDGDQLLKKIKTEAVA